MVFRGGEQVEKVGPDPKKLQDVIKKLVAEMDGSQAYGAGPSGSVEWRKADLPKGYSDVTDQVDVKGLELLNSDSEFGGVRTLVEASKPSALDSKGKAGESKKDWVESDTDEQLMMFMPFQAQLKVHTLQVRDYNIICYTKISTDSTVDHFLAASLLRRRRRDTATPKDSQSLHQHPSYPRF